MLRLPEDGPLAKSLLAAIHTGDVDGLLRLLCDHPAAGNAIVERRPCGPNPAFAYPLVAATADYPGHFPRVAETIRALVAASADVNAPCEGRHRETALHWAASCDDVEALDALLDAGASIEAPGAVIAGGTPLDDAVAFAQWQAARRLVERGAQMAVWHAAALGRVELLESYFADDAPAAKYPWGATRPSAPLHIAFWCACHGVQRAAAEWLLARGADVNWVAPWDGSSPLDAARRSGGNDLVRWLEGMGGKAALA